MKKGYIKISDAFYRNYDLVYPIFKDFKPTHIEFRHWENDAWYIWGECDFFDNLKEGDAIPQYDVEMTKQKDGSLTYKFRKA